MSKEKLLITGGAGFIGRALAARCLAEGHDVTVVDNLCAGRTGNLDPFLGQIDFHRIDVLDRSRLQSVMNSKRPKIVFHLAAHHFIPFCTAHPQETLRVNVEGTQNVLSEAERAGAGVAVVASSGALYPSLDSPLTEDVEPAPADVYGLSKQLAETVSSFIVHTTDLSCISARLFNTYGPYETNPHLIPHIVDSLKREYRVELGNIETKRDYIYVDDVADLLYRLSQNCHERYSVVNVGTGAEHSAREIVDNISELLGEPIQLVSDHKRLRVIDKLHQRADVRRLKALAGATASHSLQEGLRKLLAHEGMRPNS